MSADDWIKLIDHVFWLVVWLFVVLYFLGAFDKR